MACLGRGVDNHMVPSQRLLTCACLRRHSTCSCVAWVVVPEIIVGNMTPPLKEYLKIRKHSFVHRP